MKNKTPEIIRNVKAQLFKQKTTKRYQKTSLKQNPGEFI